MNPNNAQEKTYLKNLGSFLGLYTLGRNRPILQIVSMLQLLERLAFCKLLTCYVGCCETLRENK